MGYKDILVYLDATPASRRRLDIAMQIGVVDGAYVTAIDASTDAAFANGFHDAAADLNEEFAAALKEHRVAGEFHIAGERGQWAPHDLTLPADLVIAPSPTPEHRPLIHPGLPDEAVRHAGAPVLVVPEDWGGGDWGKRVVIAWNGSREARRALHDALPILKRAESVAVFVFAPGESPLRASAQRTVAHLQRHGVTAHIADWTHTGDITAVEALFASLDAQTADLLVAGAFGHSGLFDSIFGSVSRDLLRQPVLPVLMSH